MAAFRQAPQPAVLGLRDFRSGPLFRARLEGRSRRLSPPASLAPAAFGSACREVLNGPIGKFGDESIAAAVPVRPRIESGAGREPVEGRAPGSSPGAGSGRHGLARRRSDARPRRGRFGGCRLKLRGRGRRGKTGRPRLDTQQSGQDTGAAGLDHDEAAASGRGDGRGSDLSGRGGIDQDLGPEGKRRLARSRGARKRKEKGTDKPNALRHRRSLPKAGRATQAAARGVSGLHPARLRPTCRAEG